MLVPIPYYFVYFLITTPLIILLLGLIGLKKFETIVSWITNKTKYKVGLLLLLFAYLFIILWRITPYYIDYFNALVGGAKGVYEKRLFHLAWWGEGIKEAFDYLGSNGPKGSTIGIATSPSHILPPLPGRRVVPYANNKRYDFVVVNYYHVVRIGFDDSDIKRNYSLVYSVLADGAHLVDVYKKK